MVGIPVPIAAAAGGVDLSKLFLFTESATFTAPEAGDYKIVGVAPGAGGCAYHSGNVDSLGGSSGGEARHALASLTAGQNVSVTIGAPGAGAIGNGSNVVAGSSAGNVLFGAYLTALGGTAAGGKNGAPGGTGGGAARYNPGTDIWGGDGGTNGSDGIGSSQYAGGTGQGATYAEALAYINEISAYLTPGAQVATDRHPQGGHGVICSLLNPAYEFGRAGWGLYTTGEAGNKGFLIVWGPV